VDVLTLILFLLGLGLLVLGAELLVRGAARLATAFGVAPLVVGLTVVAFATSCPELAVSLRSAFAGEPDLALGNVVGSNIANILLILGLAAVAAPLVVAQKLIRLDIPLMIALSVVVLLMGLDGTIGRADGAILTVLLAGYLAWTVRESRRETRRVQREYEEEYRPVPRSTREVVRDAGLVAGGLALLLLGAEWLVDGAVAFALWLGASRLVVGLTVVAIGTSLPELATSVVASLRGQRDIAVGNAIGSNIMNILSVLGLTSLLAPEGIAVSHKALVFDLPVMIGVAVACLPILYVDYRISRREGWLLLACYAAYLLYLVLDATRNGALTVFTDVMLYFALPLTAATIVFRVLRFRRRGRAR
jgi:cation:H+ antiporter